MKPSWPQLRSLSRRAAAALVWGPHRVPLRTPAPLRKRTGRRCAPPAPPSMAMGPFRSGTRPDGARSPPGEHGVRFRLRISHARGDGGSPPRNARGALARRAGALRPDGWSPESRPDLDWVRALDRRACGARRLDAGVGQDDERPRRTVRGGRDCPAWGLRREPRIPLGESQPSRPPDGRSRRPCPRGRAPRAFRHTSAGAVTGGGSLGPRFGFASRGVTERAHRPRPAAPSGG